MVVAAGSGVTGQAESSSVEVVANDILDLALARPDHIPY